MSVVYGVSECTNASVNLLHIAIIAANIIHNIPNGIMALERSSTLGRCQSKDREVWGIRPGMEVLHRLEHYVCVDGTGLSSNV